MKKAGFPKLIMLFKKIQVNYNETNCVAGSMMMNFHNFVDCSGPEGAALPIAVENPVNSSEAVAHRGGFRGGRPKRSQWREKQYYCPKCGRGFTLKSNLKRHYNVECGQAPRYQCPYCHLKSKQTSQIYSHIRNKHPGAQVFYVDIMTKSDHKNN